MRNLTDNQKEFILRHFFKNKLYVGWRTIATELLESGKCNVAGETRIWVSETVFRKPLLRETKIGNGTFEPIKMYRYILKEKLLSFRCNQEIGVDVIQSYNV